jgi:hypothetical protein
LKSKTQTITFQNPKSGFFNLKIWDLGLLLQISVF